MMDDTVGRLPKIWVWVCGMPEGGGGGTPYNGLYGEALPERGIVFRLWEYKIVEISQVEVYERVPKSII